MGKQTLEIYTIDSDYIKFLSKFDKNVMVNLKSQSKFNRPYVGVVLDIGNYFYYAPLTHNGYKWIGFKDHIVLDHGQLGAVKIGRMVPVSKKFANSLLFIVLRSFYQASKDKNLQKYGNLLYLQHKQLNNPYVKFAIHKKALLFIEKGIHYKYTCNFTKLQYAADMWEWTFKPIKNIIENSQMLVY